MSDTPDDVLISRAQAGDSQAVSALYQRYVDKITRYVSYRLSDPMLIEDVIADVFLAMVESLPRYTPTGAPFEAWLYRIAEGKVADHYRQQERRPQTDLGDWLESDQPPVELNIQQAEEFETLRQALGQLNEEHQLILILRFVERKSHDEVAQILDKSPGAVATAQHRALKQLAKLLGTEKDTRHYIRGS